MIEMKKNLFAIAIAATMMFTANESFAQLKLPAASSAQTVTQGLGIMKYGAQAQIQIPH